ncbi:MAG: thiamine phosphate synthase [bacterium]
MDLTLYVVTDREISGRSHEDQVDAAISGGATVIQLREKALSARDAVAIGRRIVAICRQSGVPFIVNDRADVAAACGADGVHLGQDDLPIPAARQILGRGKLIGASAGTIKDAQRAAADGADYLGVGSVFASSTKADAGEPIGIAGLAAIVRAVRVPVVGIGGITAENAADVISAGAAGVAVVAAVVGQDDIAGAAKRLRERIDAARDGR